MKKTTGIAAALAWALLAYSCAEPAGDPSILSFAFAKSDNAVLAADATGTVDDELGVITVRLPASVTDYSSLKPTITVSTGASVAPAASTDYSTSPTPVSVALADGTQRTYLVSVSEAIAYAPATAVLFTEYYAGTGYGYGYSDKRNRWLEITNVSGAAVNLAQYTLVKRARVDGVRAEGRDVSVTLSGTLAAGSSLVIYNGATNTTRFPLGSAVTAPDLLVSDAAYNGVLDCDGDDGFQLARDGVVLDALGPNGGTGADYCWGREKRMLRKSGNVASAAWAPLQWISYGVKNNAEDYASAGDNTSALPSATARLTFFAFERLDEPVYGVVNEAAKTVDLAVPSGTDLSAIVVSIGVEGQGATVGTTVILSGETALDLRSPATVRVYATDQVTYADYVVTVIDQRDFAYTTTNYGFNGGIGALRAALTASVTTYPADTYIEGIVTGKNVYFKYTAASDYCFFLQDSTGGIMIWTDAGIDVPLGTRLRVEVLKGLLNYTMPMISECGEISRVDADTYDIYYKEGNYASAAGLGYVYKYTGSIAAGMADYSEGTFSGSLMFQGVDNVAGLAERLETGDTGSFYGPILVSYSKYKMCLSQLEQIK